MTNWDSVSAIAGVVAAAATILIIPAGYRGLMAWHHRPKECECFGWNDIWSGEAMHDCAGFCYHSQYAGSMHQAKSARCWGDQLMTTFSRSWLRLMQKSRGLSKAPQPTILTPNKSYIRTDAQTIKAFILCSHGTTDITEFDTTAIAWGPDGHRHGTTTVLIRTLKSVDSESIIVAHIEGTMRISLTKEDVNGITSGYPPWYRHSMTLLGSPAGRKVPSPIRTYSDVYRAGWLIGLAISSDLPLAAAPRSKLFADRPVRRLLDLVNSKIYPAFPCENVKMVAEAVAAMIRNLSESGVFIYLKDDQGFRVNEYDEIKTFSESEATFAMNLFNTPPITPLTDAEITRLKPMLVKVFCAVYVGSSTVVKAFKNMSGSIDDWPKHLKEHVKIGPPGSHGWCWALQNPQQTIYLEDCGSKR
ncbi:unnamed protein product [Alternaria alternata]